MGISAKSIPTGRPATPVSSRIPLISATALPGRPASGAVAPRMVVQEAMQCSGFSQGQYIRWCTAAEPKSHRNSSPVRVYSAYRHSLSLVHSPMATPVR